MSNNYYEDFYTPVDYSASQEPSYKVDYSLGAGQSGGYGLGSEGNSSYQWGGSAPSTEQNQYSLNYGGGGGSSQLADMYSNPQHSNNPYSLDYSYNPVGNDYGYGSSTLGAIPMSQKAAEKGWTLPAVSQGQADLFKGLASLYTMQQGNQKAEQLREAAKQQDPFGAQRPFYQQQLQSTYSNPRAFMETPESRLQMDSMRKQLERMDAKAGRRSQYGARAVQLATEQAKQLANYRSGLQAAAGTGITGQGAGQLYSSAADAQMNANSAPFQALSDIFTGGQDQYKATQTRIKALEDAFAAKKG
jgi:hypothetical protein